MTRPSAPRRLHDEALKRWYKKPPANVDGGSDFRSLVLAQHFCNFTLWGLEDEARRRDVGDSVIADVKRAIDRWNQRRNDLVERIDEALLEQLPPPDTKRGEQHSETPGQMIDRLSILALKIRNVGVYAERSQDSAVAAECRAKLKILAAQRRDLAGCLRRLLDDCRHGRRFFKVYRQFKAYNDPRLNPALARGGRQAAPRRADRR